MLTYFFEGVLSKNLLIIWRIQIEFQFKALNNRPKALRDKVFDRLFEEAEIARFTPRELREYEDSRKAYRDLKNSLDTALRQGHAKGLKEGHAKGLEEGRAEGLARAVQKA